MICQLHTEFQKEVFFIVRTNICSILWLFHPFFSIFKKFQYATLCQFEESVIISWSTGLFMTKKRKEQKTLLNKLWLSTTKPLNVFCTITETLSEPSAFHCKVPEEWSKGLEFINYFFCLLMLLHLLFKGSVNWDLRDHQYICHVFTDGNTEAHGGWLALKGGQRQSRGLILALSFKISGFPVS